LTKGLAQNNGLKFAVEVAQGLSPSLPKLQDVIHGNHFIAALVEGFGDGLAHPGGLEPL
jgi:hypothetical protein